MSDGSLVDHCLHRVVVVHCVLCVSCSVGVHICLSVHATDVNNPMNSVDMRGVSTPVLPVTAFSVMEPVVTSEGHSVQPMDVPLPNPVALHGVQLLRFCAKHQKRKS